MNPEDIKKIIDVSIPVLLQKTVKQNLRRLPEREADPQSTPPPPLATAEPETQQQEGRRRGHWLEVLMPACRGYLLAH